MNPTRITLATKSFKRFGKDSENKNQSNDYHQSESLIFRIWGFNDFNGAYKFVFQPILGAMADLSDW